MRVDRSHMIFPAFFVGVCVSCNLGMLNALGLVIRQAFLSTRFTNTGVGHIPFAEGTPAESIKHLSDNAAMYVRMRSRDHRPLNPVTKLRSQPALDLLPPCGVLPLTAISLVVSRWTRRGAIQPEWHSACPCTDFPGPRSGNLIEARCFDPPLATRSPRHTFPIPDIHKQHFKPDATSITFALFLIFFRDLLHIHVESVPYRKTKLLDLSSHFQSKLFNQSLGLMPC